LYWLDFGGKRRDYGSLPARGRVTEHTFVSHIWLVAESDGKAVAIFVATPKPGLAELR
jgi:hypothetical protein